jgi:hypothetical protein
MSLKAVHIIFIICSTLLVFGFGAWSLYQYFNAGGEKVNLVWGIGSIAAGIGLLWYGKYFLKKLKNISYL